MLVAGQACLIVAFVCALYGVAASLYGARSRRREWVASGRRAVYAMALSTAVAFVLLEAAFVRSDFDFAVVASHSSTTTPLFYRLTAMWSSQEGSLLLWLFLLGAWSSLILFITRHRLRVLAPYATGVLLGFGAFFAGLLVFAESPFAKAPMRVSDFVKGLPGHPLHPTADRRDNRDLHGRVRSWCSECDRCERRNTAAAWWPMLVLGLCLTVPTALTGL